MLFRVARESEFENKKGKLNPLRDTAYAERVRRVDEFEGTWLLELADLQELRSLHHEIVQIKTGGDPPTLSIDFLPHYLETPPEVEGVIFICD